MTQNKKPKTVDVNGTPYHVTGNTAPSKGTTRRYVEKEMDEIGMTAIGWYAVKRCKLAISIACNLMFIYMQFHKFIG